MSQLPDGSINPYQSPAADGALLSGPDHTTAALVKMLRDFRSQILALGVFWIVIGLAAAGFGFYFAQIHVPGYDSKWLLGLVVGSLGATWLILGGLVCAKQIWALYAALALSYVSLLGNLVQMNLCPAIFLVVVIMQAHRVLGWANKLRAAGIPLTSKPSDLRIP